jgi:hypothetical protein
MGKCMKHVSSCLPVQAFSSILSHVVMHVVAACTHGADIVRMAVSIGLVLAGYFSVSNVRVCKSNCQV